MRDIRVFFAAFLSVLLLSGCVTSHYVNKQGCECTRRYFNPFGLFWRSCSDTPSPEGLAAQKAQGEELKIAPSALEPSLRQTQPAKTIAQNIKATTQGMGR